MSTTTTRLACYRRPNPSTGHIHVGKQRLRGAGTGIGQIEYTLDPAFFFHSEKYRGSNEANRISILEATSMDQVRDLLIKNRLTEPQLARWRDVSSAVLRCAVWFALSQNAEWSDSLSPDRFDDQDILAVARIVQERMQSATRLVITGSRDLAARVPAYSLIDWFVEDKHLRDTGFAPSAVDEVISGNANGGDAIGEEWAMQRYIPVAHYPKKLELGNRAGFIRNEQIEKVGTHLLAFHLRNSSGTAHMIDTFILAKKPHYTFTEKDVNQMREMLAKRAADQ